MPFQFRGRPVLEQEIAHQVHRQTAVEDFILLKRLQAEGSLLLRMQPCQRRTFKQDQFGFSGEKLFVNDEIVERIIFRRHQRRAVGLRISRINGRRGRQRCTDQHREQNPYTVRAPHRRRITWLRQTVNHVAGLPPANSRWTSGPEGWIIRQLMWCRPHRSIVLLIVLPALLVLSGCKPDDSPFRAENDTLKKQLTRQESLVTSLQDGNKVMQQQIDLLNQEIRDAKK